MQNLAEQASCKMGDEQGANCFFNFLSGFKMGDVQGDNCFFNFLSGFPIGRGGGVLVGCYLIKFYTGRIRPEVQPLTLYIPFLTEKVPLWSTFY